MNKGAVYVTRKRFSSYMDPDLLEALKDISYYTGQTVPDTLEEAAEMFVKHLRAQAIQCYDPNTRTAFLKPAGQDFPARSHDLTRGRPIGT